MPDSLSFRIPQPIRYEIFSCSHDAGFTFVFCSHDYAPLCTPHRPSTMSIVKTIATWQLSIACSWGVDELAPKMFAHHRKRGSGAETVSDSCVHTSPKAIRYEKRSGTFHLQSGVIWLRKNDAKRSGLAWCRVNRRAIRYEKRSETIWIRHRVNGA